MAFFPPSHLYALSFLHVNISVSVNELNIEDTRSLGQVSFIHADPLSLATVAMTTKGTELEMSGEDQVQVGETQKTGEDGTMAGTERDMLSCTSFKNPHVQGEHRVKCGL